MITEKNPGIYEIKISTERRELDVSAEIQDFLSKNAFRRELDANGDGTYQHVFLLQAKLTEILLLKGLFITNALEAPQIGFHINKIGKSDKDETIEPEEIVNLISGAAGFLPKNSTTKNQPPPKRKKEIFISYCHKDQKWFDLVQIHLAPLLDHCALNVWSDTMIEPGQIWFNEIEGAMNRSDAAILLLSPHFLASNFIKNEELPKLLKKYNDGNLKIFWLLVSPCLFEISPLKDIQAAYPLDNNKSLKGMTSSERDRVLVGVMKKIKSQLA